ncbi:hypothetical protein V2J09_009140 [Rumex salicifolius]
MQRGLANLRYKGMPIGCEESPTSSASNGGNEAGDFECNICFDLAQDPIVTLCGHLFCWPCLYRWLHHHSQSQECPVCKAIVQQEKLVPLYGRGKTSSDPRSRPVPGMEIPNRPPGQRPDTAPPPPPPEPNVFPNFGFGLLGGFIPMATTTIGNMTMSAGFGGFGGFFPGFFNFQFHHGFPEASMPAVHRFPYGYTPANASSNVRPVQQRAGTQSQDSLLTGLLVMIGLFVFVTLFWN